MSALLSETKLQRSYASSIDSTGEAISSLTPELVIALCGPIGSPLHQSAMQIKNTLAEFEYQTEIVRLSDLIRLNAKKVNIALDADTKFDEIQSLIKLVMGCGKILVTMFLQSLPLQK